MSKIIDLDYVTKIEGHARLFIKIDKGKIKKCNLQLFEGSRFFEGILKGKLYNDISHISSRICGICSVVHTITALKAIENAFKVGVSEQTKLLRELLLIGGLIQSHSLHLYFLALPDYRGFSSALEMASKHREDVVRGLELKKIGNQIVRVIGGRDIHPIAAVVGGFSRLPKQKELDELLDSLKKIRKNTEETVNLFCSLKYPDHKKYTEYFALQGNSYFNSDKIISCVGQKCVPTTDYEKHFREYFKEGSTAEFATKDGKSYMVGALARIVNNQSMLSAKSRKYAQKILDKKFSPYMNNAAQAIEIFEGVERCIDILEKLKLKKEELTKIIPKAGSGIGTSEAPRGILFHHYMFDENGVCTMANITTPTTQNLENIGDNIRLFLPKILDKSKEEIQLKVEELIRAYDPCISCSTHFLEINWEQS